jgi:hypothetical protein
LTPVERLALESASGPLGAVRLPSTMSRRARLAILAALRRKGLITYVGGDPVITVEGEAAVAKRSTPQ